MGKHLTVLMALFLSVGIAAAQNISEASIRWTCDQTTDLRTDSTGTYACAFITQGSASISWRQRNDEIVTHYTVTGTEGTWTNVSQEGLFTYFLSRDGSAGRLIIQRTGGQVTVLLDFSESGAFNIKRKFSVSEVAVLP